MAVACVALLGLVLLLRFGPDIPFLQLLRRAAVEMPIRRLSQLGREQIFAMLIIGAIILAGGKLFIAFAPDLVALVATNLGVYFDAIAVSALLSMATAVHRAARIIRVKVCEYRSLARRALRCAVREVRTRPLPTKFAADNDDEPAGRILPWAA